MAIYSGNKNAAEMAWLRFMAQDDAAQQQDYRTYRNYYNGDHNVPLTTRQAEYLEISGIDFRNNYLRLPVQVLSQRFQVRGFSVKDEPEGEKKLGDDDGLLWKWWELNRMDAIQNNVHEANAVDGDTFILVEWDENASAPRFFHERAYDGDEGVKVHYSESARRQPFFATKRWRETDETGRTNRRLTVYAREAIYRYTTKTSGSEGGWQEYHEDGKAWPEPWPLDFIPVIPFRHNDDGSNWGRSELEDIISDQEALNKSVLDVLEGGDKTAFQLITLSGGLAQTKDGSAIEVTPRQILSHKTGTWGYIPAGDLDKLRENKNDFIIAIAQKAQIPLNYFQVTGQVASHLTQQADDSNLVSKAEWYAVPVGNAWEDVMLAAIKMANEFGGMGLDEETMVKCQWDSFERIDKLAVKQDKANLIDILVRAGSSLEGALKFAEVDDEEAELMLIGDTPTGIEQ
jgi:hypothetical protein